MADILSTPGLLGAEHPFPAGETRCWHGGDPGDQGVTLPAGEMGMGMGEGRVGWGQWGLAEVAGEGKEGRDGELEVDRD